MLIIGTDTEMRGRCITRENKEADTLDKPKLRLNIRQPTSDDGKAKEAIKAATKRKADANESMEDAWLRIFESKLTDADKRKLVEVKRAMESGAIGRLPEERVNKNGSPKRFSKAEALRLYTQLRERQREETLRKMVEEMPSNYWLITDEERLDEFLDILADEDEIVFDVETTGTDVWSDYIVGHVITAVKADIHAYIPTKHRSRHSTRINQTQLPHEYVIDRLKPYYEDETLGKIAHNASFDIHMLDREGIKLQGLTWDTLEGMKMLNENEPTFALKPLVSKYLGEPSQTYGELFGNKGFDEIPLDQATAYAAKDGDVTLRLRDFQRKHLSEMPSVLEYFETVEVPLISIITETEKEGYVMDLEFARKYGDELRKESAEYGRRVFEVLGDINLNSPIQLKEAIEKHIGKTIANTDAKQTLKPLAKDYPIIADLLKYREINKLLSTYIDVLPTLIKEKTGRIHTQFNQNGAKTGRFSSGGSGFNLQNQPYKARKMFVAPEGYYIVNADFSAQEVRIIASESGEQVLLDAFREGRDAYATLASRFFGLPYEDCYKNPDGSDTEYRKQMKVVLLSSMYGASKYGLAQSLGISVDEAEKFRVDFFKTYRKIDAFIKETQAFANKYGFVWIGDKMRKRRLPDAKGDIRRYDPKRNRAMRQGPNARIQGLAAIQTKVTLVELDKVARQRGWKHFGAIHDEIIVLMPTTATEEDFRELERVMTESFKFPGVDNATDIEIQRRWSDSITLSEYLAGKEVPPL